MTDEISVTGAGIFAENYRRLLEGGWRPLRITMALEDGKTCAIDLAGRAVPGKQKAAAAPRPRATALGLWQITDHVCSECMGRVLIRMDGDQAGLIRCSMCAREGSGDVESVCACGGRIDPAVDVGFRCAPNHHRSFEQPYEIVVVRAEPVSFEELRQPGLPLRILGES